ncbi:MAG TPA: cytochrome c oxidase subunit II [Xanthobacteraceae bacterium]
MRVISRICVAAPLAVMAIAGAGTAWAGYGQPSPWQIGFQGAVTPVMDDIVWFHNDFLLWIITAITVFVLILLAIIVVRFNSRAHPTPSRTTHNTLLELAWTLIPVLILMAIAIPSFKLLFFQLNTPPADLTVKATGKQWFWSYSYPDNGKFEYDSLMLKDDERQARLAKDPKADVPRLLSVDNELVVPVNKVVRVLVTGADVIHSWSVPSFGVKIDAIPGRINETWFKATREGMYYGQCSQLCGRDHAFMPIAVHVVSDQEFQAWVADAKKKYASDDTPATVAVAAKSSKDTPTAVAAR